MDNVISEQSVINTIHKTIYNFFDVVEDDSGEPMNEKDKLLLRVNKAICNEIKKLPSASLKIIRCKNCKHRPTATEAEKQIYWGFSVEFPDDVCPLQCEDGWYNHYPDDEFYCGKAERQKE